MHDVSALHKRRTMKRTLIIGVIVVLALAGSAIKLTAQSAPAPPTRAELAQKILNSPSGKYMTGSARQALETVAHGDSSFSHAGDQGNSANVAQAPLAQGGVGANGPGLTNVRVNDPG